MEAIAKVVVEGKKPRDPVSTKPVQLLNHNLFRNTCLMSTSFMNWIRHAKRLLISLFLSSLSSILEMLLVSKIANKRYLFKITLFFYQYMMNLNYFYYKVMRVISPVEFKKLKKEFLNLSKLHPPKSKDKFGDAFLEFINGQITE